LTRLVLVVIIGAITGCASLSLPLPSRPSTTLLVQADRMVGEGQYAEALDVYGEVMAKYPNTDDATRARTRRDTVAGLLAARAQVARLTAEMKAQEAELVRTREQVAARDGELARARQEIGRLTAETDRLRTDLENLKKIDIDLERRRK
jgi:hypothetical protein